MQGEYRGDFTRDTFHPLNHVRRVLMQQGRVQLDADWNEQVAVLLHYLQNLTADLIGQHGGPKGNRGFEIKKIEGVKGDFGIGAGHYYVDGVPCEPDRTAAVQASITSNSITLQGATPSDVKFKVGECIEIFDPSPTPKPELHQISGISATGELILVANPNSAFKSPMIRHAITYKTQSDWPFPVQLEVGTAATPKGHLIYLDVWERHVACAEDDSIREIGLGGPDTATRSKVLWQVRTNAVTLKLQAKRPFVTDPDWRIYVSDNLQPENRGFLKARVRAEAASTDPCTTSPMSRYRGAENQLYRVEIHRNGTIPPAGGTNPPPTFKWSRENSSTVFPISKLSKTRVTLETLGRDHRLRLKIGDYVEVVDDDYTLQERADPLLQVIDIDPTELVVILSEPPGVGDDSTKHPFLRRWDHKPGPQGVMSDGAAPIVESADGNAWLDLEDGIQIQFQPGATGAPKPMYRTGDFWLIPARVAIGDIEWPRFRDDQGQRQPAALPPHGVEHHYAPLALITVAADGTVNVSDDLRREFEAAAS